MDTVIKINNEERLEAFRTSELSSGATLQRLAEHRRVLVSVPVGVGKTFAVDSLLADPETYARYDLVVYLTPANNIIDERPIVRGDVSSPVPWTRWQARPRAMCGALNEEWEALETRGCSAYARMELCGKCEKRTTCPWYARFTGESPIGRLVFATDQNMVVNKFFINFLRTRTRAASVLVVLDEAQIADATFNRHVEAEELERFAQALPMIKDPVFGDPEELGIWISSVAALIAAPHGLLDPSVFRFPHGINREAFLIQKAGFEEFHKRFNYLGYVLNEMTHAKSDNLVKNHDGSLTFSVRPLMGADVLLLSANMDRAYVEDRLKLRGVASPFERHRFNHPETRIININNRVGALTHFKRQGKHNRVLGFFATLIARNISQGRTTLLVSRMEVEADCAKLLSEMLAAWGVRVRFVLGEEPLPTIPEPGVIPLIHYGVRGINRFEQYDACYCLNSYYVSAQAIENTLCDSDLDRTGASAKIDVRQPDDHRVVEVLRNGERETELSAIANCYLMRLEVDAVIQAVGRVRPFTRPREVILFQRNDLSPRLDDVVELRTLEAARSYFNVPKYTDVARLRLAAQHAKLMEAEGLSAREASAKLGVPWTTMRRHAQLAEQVGRKTLYNIYNEKWPTPGITSTEVISGD